MITTDKKFVECDYRIKFDIRDCTECNICFECEEHENHFIDDCYCEKYAEEFDLFETIASYFMPIADKLPC
jgi:hypothetical protein